jgi:single-strand DNA-binding protein
MAGGVGLAGSAAVRMSLAAADPRRLSMANEAFFAVSGYVATQPKIVWRKDGSCSVSMRVAWTPRVLSKETGEWTDQQTSFVSVICYRKVAENASKCLRRGDPIVLRGTLKVGEYVTDAGVKRYSVDVVADSLGHDLSKGTSHFTKTPKHAEQTAEEYESSTVGRNPLPGDVAAHGRAGGELSDASDPGERQHWASADESEEEPDPAELADLAELTDPASEEQDAELVGART